MSLATKEGLKETARDASSMRIKITENGPYLVSGAVPLKEKIITPVGHLQELRDGKIFEQAESYALCRCGHSNNHPFCDGTHIKADFSGGEQASRSPYKIRASILEGPELDLLDDNRCAFARFCHREEGDVWELTEKADSPRIGDEALTASSECPAGRLVHYDKEGNEYEPQLDPEIIIMQDPAKDASSGLFVKGGITLEAADGTDYELRNRYMLCRCGNSRNKPFCDASHVPTHFNDH